MTRSEADLEEIPLTGGRSTHGVVRVGDTVRRPIRPNARFVHALLTHLEGIGFDGAPRFLGLDEQGREMLTFIEGHAPPDLGWFTDEQLVAASRLIRRYHDATAGSSLASEGEIVCHNDLSPCNAVFVDGAPIALIDFDAAAPGPRLRDLAYAAWLWLDIGNDDIALPEQARRLHLFCEVYGEQDVPAVVEAILHRQCELADEFLHNTEVGVDQRVNTARWAMSCRAWVVANAAHWLLGPDH